MTPAADRATSAAAVVKAELTRHSTRRFRQPAGAVCPARGGRAAGDSISGETAPGETLTQETVPPDTVPRTTLTVGWLWADLPSRIPPGQPGDSPPGQPGDSPPGQPADSPPGPPGDSPAACVCRPRTPPDDR